MSAEVGSAPHAMLQSTRTPETRSLESGSSNRTFGEYSGYDESKRAQLSLCNVSGWLDHNVSNAQDDGKRSEDSGSSNITAFSTAKHDLLRTLSESIETEPRQREEKLCAESRQREKDCAELDMESERRRKTTKVAKENHNKYVLSNKKPKSLSAMIEECEDETRKLYQKLVDQANEVTELWTEVRQLRGQDDAIDGEEEEAYQSDTDNDPVNLSNDDKRKKGDYAQGEDAYKDEEDLDAGDVTGDEYGNVRLENIRDSSERCNNESTKITPQENHRHTSRRLPGALPDLSGLRRPQTSDTNAFWYCSQDKWDDFVVSLQAKATKKVALHSLRKFDAVGRIMETSEGMAAPRPCDRCTRKGSEEVCRVWKDKEIMFCAYCKRMNKPHCLAGRK